jgi:hypothetical protein
MLAVSCQSAAPNAIALDDHRSVCELGICCCKYTGNAFSFLGKGQVAKAVEYDPGAWRCAGVAQNDVTEVAVGCQQKQCASDCPL